MVAISVVLPTYNREKTLTRSIDSVLEQTFQDFELIVVDDASTDDTTTVIDQYDDSRIQFVSHEENRGGSAARNTGIDRAEGEYIAFLDSDDEWKPSKLQRQIERLESSSDEWIAAYCGYRTRTQGATKHVKNGLKRAIGSATRSTHGAEGGEELIPEVLMMQLSAGAGSTLLVNAETVEEIDGFDETFERHQDLEFLVRLLHVGKLAYVDEDLVTLHDTGAPSLGPVKKSKEKYLSKFETEIERAENIGYDVTSQHRFDLARYHFRAGKFREGTSFIDRTEMLYQQNLSLVRCALAGSIRTVTEAIS